MQLAVPVGWSHGWVDRSVRCVERSVLYSVGPFIKYKAKFGEGREIDFGLKWAHEVEVENRMKGDAIFLDISGTF